MRIITAIIALTLSVSTTVMAETCPNQTTVFHCQTQSSSQNPKRLNVCANEGQLIYQFGRDPKSPDKAIIQAVDKVDYQLWDGKGDTIRNTITFLEGNYSYRVFSHHQQLLGRGEKEKPLEAAPHAGVIVEANGKRIATINCRVEGMIDNIQAFKNKTLPAPNSRVAIKENAPVSCETPVFSCETKKEKMLRVCKSGTDYLYSYGREDETPELALRQNQGQVTKSPWNGFGRHITQSLTFHHGDTDYSVFSSYERAPNGTIEGGVIVERKGGKAPITVDCLADTMKEDLASELE